MPSSDEATYKEKAWGKLERHPVHRLRLLRQLADGSETQESLAANYGVSQSAISQFASRNAETIEEIRRNLDDEFAGILYVKKAERLSAYADMIEAADGATSLADVQRALRNMAEELGALPNRLNVSTDQPVNVNVNIQGADGV